MDSGVDGRSGVGWDYGELGKGRASMKERKERWMLSEQDI